MHCWMQIKNIKRTLMQNQKVLIVNNAKTESFTSESSYC